ncbi:hypothetical protein [Pseudoruegeria sp. SHC-113]|uniref:hypothetical protein n=1 Tax=Pseudoruegeria sp. SHC-113 TaxID=2855439 RepID=UPI0021BAF3E9|nr:hypothetical protein [Pseudoruegeria sp. SHC-113]MCT8159628.1 hypothetical protein [Pseudoruegeria sp. SHC-113]
MTRFFAALRRIWRAAPVASLVLAVALLASAVFGLRAALHWHQMPPRAERMQPVAGWMTPRYVARSWRVPPEVVLEAIDAPRPPPDGPMSLDALATFRGVPTAQVISEAEAAIAAFHAAKRAADEGKMR